MDPHDRCLLALRPCEGHRYNRWFMSLITRCPACGTMFKVVPDQLRISEGWVRCGHCAEVFDATAHMQTPEALAAVQVPAHVADDVDSMVDSRIDSEVFPSSLVTEIEGVPSG